VPFQQLVTGRQCDILVAGTGLFLVLAHVFLPGFLLIGIPTKWRIRIWNRRSTYESVRPTSSSWPVSPGRNDSKLWQRSHHVISPRHLACLACGLILLYQAHLNPLPIKSALFTVTWQVEFNMSMEVERGTAVSSLVASQSWHRYHHHSYHWIRFFDFLHPYLTSSQSTAYGVASP